MKSEELAGKTIKDHSVQVFEGLTIVEVDFTDGSRHLIVADHKTGKTTERLYSWQEVAGQASR
jgi:hypothetical protein